MLACCHVVTLKHYDNSPALCIPPYTPLLYSKIGVYRGIHIFLIFALKHRLWVLVRTASMLTTVNVLSKNKKNITISHLKIIFFTAVKNCSILHGRVFVMNITFGRPKVKIISQPLGLHSQFQCVCKLPL